MIQILLGLYSFAYYICREQKQIEKRKITIMKNTKYYYLDYPVYPVERGTQFGIVDLQEGLKKELQIEILGFEESDIKTKYCPNEYFYKEDGKYEMYDENDWLDGADIIVYEEKDTQKMKEADVDDDYFSIDSNFIGIQVSDSFADTKEVVEYWDGNNWVEAILYSDTFPSDMTPDEKWEKAEWTKIYSTFTGQGTYHDEYYMVECEDGEIYTVYRPVSYFQGDLNNSYFPVNKEKLKEADLVDVYEAIEKFHNKP